MYPHIVTQNFCNRCVTGMHQHDYASAQASDFSRDLQHGAYSEMYRGECGVSAGAALLQSKGRTLLYGGQGAGKDALLEKAQDSTRRQDARGERKQARKAVRTTVRRYSGVVCPHAHTRTRTRNRVISHTVRNSARDCSL